ncbi:MAG TPA: hypothetical protein VN238_15335 [Solirubrobacteraceae bacterium]|nr:hypothetical protein [Solirubrobacteraceae bacterium]
MTSSSSALPGTWGVERHRPYAQLLGHPAHRQRRQTFAIGDQQAGSDGPVNRQ